MKIAVWVLSAALATAASAGEKRSDFGGTWVLVPEKSEMEQVRPGLRNIRVTGGPVTTTGSAPEPLPDPSPAGFITDLRLEITQAEDRIRVVRRFTLEGRMDLVTQEFTFDGGRCLNVASDGRGEFASRSEWKKGKLLNSGTQTIADGAAREEHNVREEFSLSRNRKTLTVKTLIATPRGLVKLKQVFAPDPQP
jgi:hypothetical protein